MTLVLLAPIGLGLESWAWVEGLDDREVVAVRYPRSVLTPGGDVDFMPLPLMADRIADRIDGPLDVVGMSLGGVVAQHLASRHPDRVRSLLLGCCPATVDSDAMRARSRIALSEGMDAMAAHTMPRWFGDYDPDHETRPGVLCVRDTLRAAHGPSFAGLMYAIASHDLRDLAPIAAPTTILTGTSDAAAPASKGTELLELIPNARLEVVRGSHLPQVDHPSEFSAALERHLDWVERSVGGGRHSRPRRHAPKTFVEARIFPPAGIPDATARLLTRVAGHRGRSLHVYDALSRDADLVRVISDLGRHFIDASTIAAYLREIAVVRVAVNLGAEYEYAQHAERARAVGVGDDEIALLLRRDSGAWKGAAAAVVALVDAMTSEIGVPDDVWETVATEFTPEQSAELVALIAFYVMIALVTDTLRVPLEADAVGWPETERSPVELSIDADGWSAR